MKGRRQRPVGKRIRHEQDIRRERIMWAKRIGYLLFALFIMGVIFFFSSQPAAVSQGLSDGLLERMISLFEGILPEFMIAFLNGYIRKIAHFVIYGLLGVALALCAGSFIYVEGPAQPEYAGIWELAAYRRSFRLSYFWLPLAIGVIYAISDEIHQLFVFGRSGEVRDVILDSCGVAVGIILVLVIGQKKRHQ